ncbi:MAG: hypothetical protein ABIA04_06820 [Pseudomonadota bacterium]
MIYKKPFVKCLTGIKKTACYNGSSASGGLADSTCDTNGISPHDTCGNGPNNIDGYGACNANGISAGACNSNGSDVSLANCSSGTSVLSCLTGPSAAS